MIHGGFENTENWWDNPSERCIFLVLNCESQNTDLTLRWGSVLVLLFSLVIDDCWPYGLIELVYRSEYLCGIWNWPPEFISSMPWLIVFWPSFAALNPLLPNKVSRFYQVFSGFIRFLSGLIRFYQVLSGFVSFYQVFLVATAGSSITTQHPSIIWIHCFVIQISFNIGCSFVFWVFSDVTWWSGCWWLHSATKLFIVCFMAEQPITGHQDSETFSSLSPIIKCCSN